VDLVGAGVQKEGIDGEIPALRIFLGGTKLIVLDYKKITIAFLLGRFTTECTGLDDVVPVVNMHKAETPANNASVAKEASDFMGRSVGRDIEILGPATNQQVPDATTYKVGLKSMPLETGHHAPSVPVQSPRVYLIFVHLVHFSLDLGSLARTTGCFAFGASLRSTFLAMTQSPLRPGLRIALSGTTVAALRLGR